MKKTKINHYTDKEALEFHNNNKSGKIEIISSKPMTTKRDLALAYSPGVAAPVRAISENPDKAYDYTTKGNLVAVISNGSAILGMGNLGALASKPVMEGKAVLFKRFADIDSIDIEIDSSDPEEIVKSIKNIAKQKPIVSVMGEVATSAAYMASLGSNYIFAQEGTITGSVGVLILSSEITELAKKIGVSTEVIKSGDLKASPSPLEKMTPKAREQMEKIVQEISKNFINLVKKERKLDNNKTQLISDGRIFTGQSALQIGLIDSIGNIKEAKEFLKTEYNIDKLPLLDFEIIKKEKLTEKFLSLFSGNFNASRFLNLQGLISIWIPNV